MNLDHTLLVDSLLNPCHCKNVRQCTCRRASCVAGPSSSGGGCSDYGLQTLAEAAVMFRDRPVLESTAKHSSDPPPWPNRADIPSRGLHATPPAHLELPPILVRPNPPASVPDFPTIPPLSAIKSIAGSGCTCGLNCACPGCVQHRTLRYAEKHHKDCSEGCGHCVDHTVGIELPGQDPSAHGGNVVDLFFARATLNRQMELDPGESAMSPLESFARSSSMETDGRLPKADYCHGQCGYPADMCQCRQSCSGCCDGSSMPS